MEEEPLQQYMVELDSPFLGSRTRTTDSPRSTAVDKSRFSSKVQPLGHPPTVMAVRVTFTSCRSNYQWNSQTAWDKGSCPLSEETKAAVWNQAWHEFSLLIALFSTMRCGVNGSHSVWWGGGRQGWYSMTSLLDRCCWHSYVYLTKTSCHRQCLHSLPACLHILSSWRKLNGTPSPGLLISALID